MGEDPKPLSVTDLVAEDDEFPLFMGEDGGVITRELPLLLLPLPLLPAILEDEGIFPIVLIMSKNKERSLIRSSYEPLSCT